MIITIKTTFKSQGWPDFGCTSAQGVADTDGMMCDE